MKKSFYFITIVFVTVCVASCGFWEDPLFKKLDATHTGISFNNLITENDSVNIIDLEYVYNGGGVAIADFNNDQLQDVFFTGNMVENRIYLNSGGMKFKDITATAGVNVPGRWNTGVAVVDINNDGWMDIYVCASIKSDPAERANMLFVNKGLDKNGHPFFREEATAYHIADTGHSTNAAFFDYDNDGDLDLYVLTNRMVDDRYPNQYRPKITDGSAANTDRLYQNNWDSVQRHPVFTNVSKKAGILIEGFGLGLNITDINNDGWKDIYVTNDYLSDDLLWINNQNGTFTNKAADYFKHTSASAMGNDVADINNDGLMDIIAVDMLPEDNYRKKMMLSSNNYNNYINNETYRYQHQYARNTLQLNMGMRPSGSNEPGHPVFGDIAFYAGIAETDWSWTPLVADFDNDGFRDIIITNGFPKDVTDHDFMVYRATTSKIASKEEMLDQIPAVKLPNYAFKNNGNLSFSNTTEKWGLQVPSFSSGAAYADLDNDGDLDVVISNINEPSFVYENKLIEEEANDNNYLQIAFSGDAKNRNALGARVRLWYGNGKQQVYEHTPYRGYLSSVYPHAFFGLGKAITTVDTIEVIWPGGKKQLLKNIPSNQLLKLNIADANLPGDTFGRVTDTGYHPLLTAKDSLINYDHKELDYVDFNIQRLLPHKHSQYGPALAVGDIDKNGLDDIVIGGSYGFSAIVLLQQSDNRLVKKELLPGADKTNKPREDMGVLLFDADNDDDDDLYIVSGSCENAPGSRHYQDWLFVNDGKGNFFHDSLALPHNTTSKSCVKAADFDKDGDLDLFVGGRVLPGGYPQPVSSYLYRNDSKNGKIIFTDISALVAPSLKNIGMISDALWTDTDNDGWVDLLLVGEWMSPVILKNEKGVFRDVSAKAGLLKMNGWWNSVCAGDFDSDGDMDYIAGNVGGNTFYKANDRYPVNIYAADFNGDKAYDAFTTVYLKATDGEKKEFPAMGRDDCIEQTISLRRKFPSYRLFADATIHQVFTKEELAKAIRLTATNFQSSYIKNLGNGKFEITPLPAAAQLSSVFGMQVADLNHDGNLDVLLTGNDHGAEVGVGRYDAFNGLVLAGDGKGGFRPLPMQESGFFVPGDGKSIVLFRNAQNKINILAGQNKAELKGFEFYSIPWFCISVGKKDAYAVVTYKDGRQRKEEFFYGSSFLSQTARCLIAGSQVLSVEIVDTNGKKRSVTLPASVN